MKKLFILGLLICFAPPLFAGQVLEMKPYETLNAKVGFNELNRVAVKGGRISDVVASGDINFQFDEDSGQIFVQPVKKGSITISLKTESGIYQDILLSSLEIPSQTILLTGDIGKIHEAVVHFEKERSYIDIITKIMKGLVSGDNPYGWSVNRDEVDIPKWFDMPMKRISFLKGHRFDGEVLQLSNQTNSVKYLTEKNFHDSNHIVAIGLSKKHLLPGEDMLIYRVHRDDKF